MELFELVGKFVFDNAEGNSAMDDTSGKAEHSESRISGSMKKIGTAIAAAFTVQKIKEFGQACIEAYNVQEQAELKLSTIMKQRMNASDASIQSVKDLASAQQALGVVGDEVQLSGAQQLATFLDSDEALKSLIPAMNDLAVQQNGVNVTSENMVSIGNMFGKVMQGQTSALSRVGITFTEAQEEVLKYGNEQERASMLAQIITDNVGNMNEVLAQTDAGKIQQAKNTLGDLQEVIGARVIPIQAKMYEAFAKIGTWIVETGLPAFDSLKETAETYLKPAFENLKEAFEHVKDAFQPLIDKFSDYTNNGQGATDSSNLLKDAFELLGDAITTVADVITVVSDWCSEHQEVITVMATIIGSLAAAFALVNGAIAIWNGVAGIATGVTTALGGAIAFLTSPIGIAIAAITAIIAIGVLLYKNWDTIKEKAGELKEHLVEAWENLKEKTSEIWESVKTAIMTPIQNAWDTVSSVVENIWNKVSGIWENIKSTTETVWEGIKEKITSPVEKAHEIVSGVVEKLKSVFDFHWELPKLKIPHISVSGGKAPYGIAGLGKLPSFSIEWYKKAMHEPVVMNEPTAFGVNSKGNVLAGGEAGEEVVSGTARMQELIAEAVHSENTGMVARMDNLTAFIEKWLPKLANMQMVMDTGTTVGALAPAMNEELGNIIKWEG